MTTNHEQPNAADGGPRGRSLDPISRDDLKAMKPEAIEAARISGQLDHLLGRQ